MDNILEKRLLSISQTLKSTSRSTGPQLFNKSLGKVVGGRKHSNESDFAEKVIEVFYNMTVPEYYEHALKEPGTKITSTGALISYSGKKTLRCSGSGQYLRNQTLRTGPRVPVSHCRSCH